MNSAQQPEIRRATPADVPGLARMLARAFLDDPVASWAWRPDGLRLGALERFQATRMRQLMGHAEVWTNDELSSAALWAPPGHFHASVSEILALVPCFLHPRLFARLPLVAYGWNKLEMRHPRSPEHFYLAVLGTEPGEQGRGLGSRVLAGVLDQCDGDGVGAYLESSKRSNIDFYARHGFKVTRELKLARRGPTMWAMWRDPR